MSFQVVAKDVETVEVAQGFKRVETVEPVFPLDQELFRETRPRVDVTVANDKFHFPLTIWIP